MTTKLWQTASDSKLHPLIEAYTVGTDYQLDQQLLCYDIEASKAHVAMLEKVGILSALETSKLTNALDELKKLWQSGLFKVKKEDEDGHTAIEAFLTEQLGDIGKKIHSGRSRNDQALVMMRLYLKDALAHITKLVRQVAEAFADSAEQASEIAMPGYTHMQKAMPTTVNVWLNSFAESFNDFIQLVSTTGHIIDQNPLGSAAGFGVSLPIDRQHTTKSLGFNKVQDNPMYCALSRGLFELLAVQALNPLMALAGKFAQDMLLFTTQEFNFLSLPNELTTGSSIMPHKRNYDLFEIMRGQSNLFGSYGLKLQMVVNGNASGYNRDIQLTKAPTIQALEIAKETLQILALVVPQIQIHKEVLKTAMSEELLSVDKVNQLVSQGVPFREAYQQVKQAMRI